MPKLTRAEILAEYLGLTPETHPACFRCDSMIVSGARKVKMWEQVVRCALPDPLAPGTEADAWWPVLRNYPNFVGVRRPTFNPAIFEARVYKDGDTYTASAEHPTPAIVRAMMSADPAFAEKMEGAEG